MNKSVLVDGDGMLFEGSDEVRPVIEEAYDSGVVFCKKLDDCWQTEDIWGGLISESFNGLGTDITSDDNSLLFGWVYLLLKHRLSQVWRLTIPFGSGMMNAIWVCGGVGCMLFCLLMSNKWWEPNILRDNCSHVWVSVPRIKLITSFFSQYNHN